MLRVPSFSLERAVADRKLILLFYKEFEKDKFFKYDRYLKRVVRPIYNLMHTRQKKTGFGVIFELLKWALENQRSEEHTSELQSRPHLVCRLLLEKKKKKRDLESLNPHTNTAIGRS